MANRRKKIPKPRNPEARLLSCPSLKLRVVEKRPSAKNERSRIKRALKAGRMPEGGTDQGSAALSGIFSREGGTAAQAVIPQA